MSATAPQHLAFAKSNFSLSGASGLYDKARPRYPAEALTKISSLLPATGGGVVVELGAGTGIFTRMLLAGEKSKKNPIKKLLAVEPAEGMREGFLAALKGSGLETKDTGIDVEIVDGVFDKIPVEDGTVDLVVAAQAFHWSNDGISAIADIARALKPGGKVALIWNLENREKAEWVAQLRDTYEPFEAGTPQYRLGLWKAMFSSSEYINAYTGPAEYHRYGVTVEGNEQLVVDRALSKSFVTSLPPNEQEDMTKKIRAIVQKGDGKVWIDEKTGTFEYPYATDLYIITKKA